MSLNPERSLAIRASLALGLPFASRSNEILHVQRGQGLETLVPRCFAERHDVLPLFLDGDVLAVAMVHPEDAPTLRALRLITRCDIQPFVAMRGELAQALDEFYGSFN